MQRLVFEAGDERLLRQCVPEHIIEDAVVQAIPIVCYTSTAATITTPATLTNPQKALDLAKMTAQRMQLTSLEKSDRTAGSECSVATLCTGVYQHGSDPVCVLHFN